MFKIYEWTPKLGKRFICEDIDLNDSYLFAINHFLYPKNYVCFVTIEFDNGIQKEDLVDDIRFCSYEDFKKKFNDLVLNYD